MSAHAEASHSHESSSSVEKKGFGPISMLRTIASAEGMREFLGKMVDDHIIPTAIRFFDFIGALFGAEGGSGAHTAHAPA